MGDGSILLPRAARALFRKGECAGKPTSGLCGGYLQANLAVCDSRQADLFSLFCKKNSAPCPLLYKSKAGEVGAGPLADDSDVRTDLPFYCVWRNGKLAEKTDSLLKYSWNSNVSFYLGCSFGFERALQDAGVPVRNIDQHCNVSMFKTNVECHAVDLFHTNLVVSMRPIPRSLLKTSVEATDRLIGAHGAPIHIGDPSEIGIYDLLNPDFGDAIDFEEGDVPVFWACGVTALESIAKSGADLAFTHSPGCMFVCDVPSDYGGRMDRTVPIEIVDVTASDQSFSASLVSLSIAEKIRQLQNQISKSMYKNELLTLSAVISQSRSVAVLLHSSLSGDEVKGLKMLLHALACCKVETIMVGVDAQYSHMQSDVENIALLFNECHGSVSVATVQQMLTEECNHVIIVANCTESEQTLSECCQMFKSVKCQIVVLGCHFSLVDVELMNIDCSLVHALGALTLSLCLLQSCAVHVRYAVKGICEGNVPVVSISDQLSSVKIPECLEDLWVFAVNS